MKSNVVRLSDYQPAANLADAKCRANLPAHFDIAIYKGLERLVLKVMDVNPLVYETTQKKNTELMRVRPIVQYALITYYDFTNARIAKILNISAAAVTQAVEKVADKRDDRHESLTKMHVQALEREIFGRVFA
jgi:hypothetical protein